MTPLPQLRTHRSDRLPHTQRNYCVSIPSAAYTAAPAPSPVPACLDSLDARRHLTGWASPDIPKPGPAPALDRPGNPNLGRPQLEAGPATLAFHTMQCLLHAAAGWRRWRAAGVSCASRADPPVPAPHPGLEPVQHTPAAPDRQGGEWWWWLWGCCTAAQLHTPLELQQQHQHQQQLHYLLYSSIAVTICMHAAAVPDGPRCCLLHPLSLSAVSCRCTWLAARPWAAAVPPMPRCTCAAAQQTMTAGSWTAGPQQMCCPGLSTARPTARVGTHTHACVACSGRQLGAGDKHVQHSSSSCLRQEPAGGNVLASADRTVHQLVLTDYRPFCVLTDAAGMPAGLVCLGVCVMLCCRCLQVPRHLWLHEG